MQNVRGRPGLRLNLRCYTSIPPPLQPLWSTLLSLQIRVLSVNVIVHRDSSPTSSFNLSITITDKRGLEQILNELPSVTRAAHLSTVLSFCITLRNHRSANRKACTNKKGYRTAPRCRLSFASALAATQLHCKLYKSERKVELKASRRLVSLLLLPKASLEDGVNTEWGTQLLHVQVHALWCQQHCGSGALVFDAESEVRTLSMTHLHLVMAHGRPSLSLVLLEFLSDLPGTTDNKAELKLSVFLSVLLALLTGFSKWPSEAAGLLPGAFGDLPGRHMPLSTLSSYGCPSLLLLLYKF
ncbi:lysyl oxidase-like protein 2/3/4 [Sarotherodon galilaeus]